MDNFFNQLVESLRGWGEDISPGCQVMSEDGVYASTGPLVKSFTPVANGPPFTGFITTLGLFDGSEEAQQAVVYHPQTPGLGMGVRLGCVEGTVRSVPDLEWYGSFVSERDDVQVHADAAYVAFSPEEESSKWLSGRIPGLPGIVGPLMEVDLRKSPLEVVGMRVAKVGRTTGLTHGVLLAYAVEYYSNGEAPVFLDFIIEAEGGNMPFSDRGDAGAIVCMQQQGTGDTGEPGQAPHWRPFGLVWAFSSQCGRSHYGDGVAPSFWSSATDLAKTLRHLQVRM